MIICANGQRYDLSHLSGRRLFAAGPGKPGGSSRISGSDGAPLRIEVPLGTMIQDPTTEAVLADLVIHDQTFTVAHGGKGGAGTARLATPTQRTPREGRSGQSGEEREVRLRLALMVDIALIGPPNAGRSTLLSVLTRAQPRIEEWPFSTTSPVLGAMLTPAFEPLVLVELPALIEGSSDGKGLGNGFLVHAERAALLVIVVRGGDTGAEEIAMVRHELTRYGHGLDSTYSIICPMRDCIPGIPENEQLPGWNLPQESQAFSERLVSEWRNAKAAIPAT